MGGHQNTHTGIFKTASFRLTLRNYHQMKGLLSITWTCKLCFYSYMIVLYASKTVNCSYMELFGWILFKEHHVGWSNQIPKECIYDSIHIKVRSRQNLVTNCFQFSNVYFLKKSTQRCTQIWIHIHLVLSCFSDTETLPCCSGGVQRTLRLFKNSFIRHLQNTLL